VCASAGVPPGANWGHRPCVSPHVLCIRVPQDAYGNYVIQSVLTVSSGALHTHVVDSIRPYLPSLRGTPHGKRILQRIGGKA
jgi:hypothetical protein